MKRVIATATAAVALLCALEVGSAQQSPTVQITAITDTDLRSWDGWVTQALRTGELQALRIESDPSLPERTIERMQQYHNGVPIWGAQVVRDLSTGVAVSIFGELSPALTISTEPTLSVAAVEQRLFAQAGDMRLLRPLSLTIATLANGERRLAYTAIVSTANTAVRMFLDAHTGAELLRYSELQTQAAVGTGRGAIGDTKKMSVLRQGGVYMADDQHRPPVLTTYDMRGNWLRAFQIIELGAPLLPSDIASDSDNEWTDPPTVDAHAYIGLTYDYFFKRHGRRGLDNRDTPVVSIVNGVRQQDWQQAPPELMGIYVFNAFWCSWCQSGRGLMYFGNGAGPQYLFDVGGTPQTVGYFSGSLDIVAHELTHGVTNFSSGLIYLNESGALNEAFSDIMGASVEFFHQPVGPGLGQADWLLGEDSLRGSQNGTRSLVNPVAFGQPDHYTLRYTGTVDNGGVHINSGIVNHAFYLAVQGGTNRVSRLAVTGVGPENRDQIEKVFYRAFAFLLPANATFAMARSTTLQAARDLYGAGSAPERAVTQAWAAVGVQ